MASSDTAAVTELIGGDGAGAAELAGVLPALSAWWNSHQADATVESWRYRLDWKPLPAASAPVAIGGTWLLAVPDDGGVRDELSAWCTQALEQRGGTVIPVVVPALGADAGADRASSPSD